MYFFGTVPRVLTTHCNLPLDIFPRVVNAILLRSVTLGYLEQFGRSFAFTTTELVPFPTCKRVLKGISHIAAEKYPCEKGFPLAVLPHSKLSA
jgi:hypothetical protein